MMRWLMALLVILNLLTLAWQWDAFARWGWGPNTAREPERLTNQIRPEALGIGTPETLQPISTETAPAESTPASVAPLATGSASTATDTLAPDSGKALKATPP